MINLLLAMLLPAQAAPDDVGQWTYRESTDAVTGKKSASARIRNQNGGRLIVRCDTVSGPIISVQFIPNPTLPAAGEKSVQVYYDEARAETATWQFPGAGGYLAEPVDVFAMVSGIAGAKTLRVDILNGEGMAPTEGTFKGPGNDTLFRQVYAACGFAYEKPPIPVNPH